MSAPAGQALIVHTDEVRSGEESIVLERSTGVESANIRISTDGLLVTAGPRSVRAPALIVTGRENEPVEFVLAVPEKITRRYRGTLAIKPSSGTLLAIVTMDRETAVASAVGAESTADTPLEALKAQAVAARLVFCR